MTKKQIEKECIAAKKAQLKKDTGIEFEDDDIKLLADICCVILELRDRYEIGNYGTRDKYDEVNAVMPLVEKIIGSYDLYNVKVR